MTTNELVSLRDYIERLLAEHTAKHVIEAQVALREAALVRTVLEQRMTDHDLRHDEQHLADQRAIDAARKAIEGRLEKLNDLRQDVERDRGQFVQRATFDAKTEATDKERAQIRTELGEIRAELSNQRGRQAAYAGMLAVGLVIVPFLILLAFRIVGA